MSLESAIIQLTAAVEALTARLNHETGRPAAVSQSELLQSVLSKDTVEVEHPAGLGKAGPPETVSPIQPIPSPCSQEDKALQELCRAENAMKAAEEIDKALYSFDALKPRCLALRGPGKHFPDADELQRFFKSFGAESLVKATEQQRLAIHLKVCEIEKSLSPST